MKVILDMYRRGTLSDGQVDAAKRWREDPYKVMLAPILFRILHDVCIKELGLEEIEARHGWPARSAKAIIGLILTAISECDGFLIAKPDVADAGLREQVEFLTAGDVDAISGPMQAFGLSLTEARLFEILRRGQGKTLSKDMLHRRLYAGLNDADLPDLKTIDVHVCKLRAKLEKAGSMQRIATVWGTGYRIKEAEVTL
ncbi:MAG: winged helix-turn-helix domain-containing protein [Paracoccaceae bacterium]|nr:winged helix-turn-helix domain-containing protein [Paracoccaceae bacterium]MDD8023172.1 winged helix-turn-helix domain-containing protein [Paracoccaceae bacterium]